MHAYYWNFYRLIIWLFTKYCILEIKSSSVIRSFAQNSAMFFTQCGVSLEFWYVLSAKSKGSIISWSIRYCIPEIITVSLNCPSAHDVFESNENISEEKIPVWFKNIAKGSYFVDILTKDGLSVAMT